MLGFLDDVTSPEWLDVIESVALIVGGFWVAYTYWRSRKGQASVGIEPTTRLHRDPGSGEHVLLVKLRIRNSSSILFRYEKATATLMDASHRSEDGLLLLIPFAEEDPLIPLYSDVSKDPNEVEQGRSFIPGGGLSLEPGESADTELAFVLDEESLGLMAMQVMIGGKQGRIGRRSYWWSTFFYVDPADSTDVEPEEGTS
jgi:hypothetical protein